MLGAISAGLMIGSALYKGWSAHKNRGNIADAKAAVGDIAVAEQQQAALANDLALEKITSVKDTGYRNLQLDFGQALTTLDANKNASIRKSGFAGNMALNQAIEGQEMSAWDSFSLNAGDLDKTFNFSSRAQDLSYKQTLASIEEKKQAELSKLEAQPDGFFEGLFS